VAALPFLREIGAEQGKAVSAPQIRVPSSGFI
jgi:hypothetical protein